jgi:uncharacterized membrane protein/nitrite reductase/ring-hydroxylating ferredoxin subunit
MPGYFPGDTDDFLRFRPASGQLRGPALKIVKSIGAGSLFHKLTGMKSRAHIKSHPIHPILVTFPIAFFIGTLICDGVMAVTGQAFFGRMAMYLEIGGIVSAVLAAIPGIIDYSSVVPPRSSAKKRATKHALLNLCMLLIFTAVLLLRRNDVIDLPVILLLEGAGVVILLMSGWLGGTLVYRNQIGVDHRYAGAGKWQEETVSAGSRIELQDLDKLEVNQMKLLHVGDKRVVIGRTESGFAAFDDHCTHRGGSLADGAMICGTVQCPWHGSQFDVKTGGIKAGPAKELIKTYEITSSEGKYYLEV